MLKPEFFDIFGLWGFIFIFSVSLWSLKKRKPIPKWALRLLILIGILGVVIDGTIVYLSFLK